jgi:hypothetical protein
MIKPSIGRVVWYYPYGYSEAQPYAAIIAHVVSDTCVNLAVFDAYGVAESQNAVPLVQDAEVERPIKAFCTWMPYQKGQAAKER